MLRTKHENISMQFIVLVTLCLCYGLTMYLSLAPAYAVPPPQQPYYVVDAYQTPAVVYRIVKRTPSPFFKRRSGNISSIALCNGQLYFCSANDRRIYQKIGQRERVVFEHRTYVRDIAVDSNGFFYFSEASGAGGDGAIYELRPRANELGSTQRFSISRRRPIRVYLRTVDRFWAGDFTFDERGILYLSSGNCTPAFIYKVPKEEGGQYRSPQTIFKDTEEPIKGVDIDPSNQNVVYYADWKQTIYKFDIRNSTRSREFSRNIAGSRKPHLSDVAFDIRIR